MKKIKIGLVGASGRMGKELSKLIADSSKFQLVCELTRETPKNDKSIDLVDVWIDFSSPAGFLNLLKIAEKKGQPIVSGTTGFSALEKKKLQSAGKKIPILWSSNMSMGVAVLNEALKSLSAISEFDFQIEEFHHNKKKDKPSGTAITLQENLNKVLKKECPPILAVRGGGIYGVHKIYAMSDEEVLLFEHSALNRAVFAKGALQAAQWLRKQGKPGVYQIRDVLFRKNKDYGT